MQKIRTVLIIATALLATAILKASEPAASPYGACSHLVREEYKNRETTMKLMQEAGIQWARADFSWGTVEPRPGEWKFERFDAVMESAPRFNIQILPILDYNNSFADPAWQHLDKWERYVKKMVERYQEQIPVWEVWNEQNLQNFWKDPDPAHYLPLLKKSYETIKSVNPDLKVAVGGYAGVPFEYIEKLYELGGGKYFDIMNVHPYSHPRPPEQELEERLAELKAMMKKYGDADKPVWITEIGWPTPELDTQTPGLIATALESVLPKKKNYRAIYINDPSYASSAGPSKETIAKNLPEKFSLQKLDFEAVKPTLDNYEVDVVIMPMSENYHINGFDRIIQYVKEGGIVVDLHGMPLWYGYEKQADGSWKKSNNSKYHEMRVGTEAWWTNKGIIPEKLAVKYSGPVTDLPDQPETITAERFLKPHNFKEGDRFIPLLQGKTDKYTGTAAAIFDFNSDWKGALIINTLAEGGGNVVDETEQAQMLPRAQLMARRCGVERIFWYEFQAPERDAHDKESHFGIMHKDFAPKPAYAAFKTLSTQLPPGSAFIEKEWHRPDKSIYYPQWKRADGTAAGALWTFSTPGVYRVEFTSDRVTFTTHTGKPLSPPLSENGYILALDNAPVYFSHGEIRIIDKNYSQEEALSAALSTAVFRAEQQYSAMLKAMEGTENLMPRRWQDNQLVTVGPKDWTSGFFPGSLWLLYEHTENKKWANAATQYTSTLEQLRNYTGNHDIGFMLYCSYGNALRLAENKAGIKDILLDAASALCTRFVPSLGMIRSWDNYTNPVIIDNMMNLELLMWAAKNSDNPLFERVALSHADQTNRRHYRSDNSAYHIVDYNPLSKKILGYYAGQGASADAPWARGQSWGLYGFTMMYRETGRKEYLERARKSADFLISHPNLPADKIPYWDYEAAEIPYAPRDVAAGAIMASALLELSTFEDVPGAAKYRSVAVQQLLSLSSPAYLAPAGKNGNFILMHAVGHLPGNSEIDVPLNYADYYYLEGLLRFQKLIKSNRINQ